MYYDTHRVPSRHGLTRCLRVVTSIFIYTNLKDAPLEICMMTFDPGKVAH